MGDSINTTQQSMESFFYPTCTMSKLSPTCDKFKDISVGDVIFAKRYRTKAEMFNYPPGHEKGPYIVIENNGSFLKAVRGTHNLDDLDTSKTWFKFFKVSSSELNNLKTDTLFTINRADYIDEERFIEKKGTLSLEELKVLSKKLSSIKDKVNLAEGVIALYENKYYFVKEKNEEYVSLIELKENSNINGIEVNGKQFGILPKDLKIVYDYKKVRPVDVIHDELISKIKDMYNRVLIADSNEKASRGCLINYNSDLFYVYGEEGQNLKCFLVKNVQHKEHRITISGAPYDAYLGETCEINQKSLFQVCLHATEAEMDQIKEMRKDYSKTQKNTKPTKKKGLPFKMIKPGAVVVEKLPLSKDHYIVLSRTNGTVCVIKTDDAINGKFGKIITLGIQEVNYIGTYDEFAYYKLCTEILKKDEKAVSQEYLLELKNRIS